jgi:hypothetical protein
MSNSALRQLPDDACLFDNRAERLRDAALEKGTLRAL